MFWVLINGIDVTVLLELLSTPTNVSSDES